ncbi:uncharacterized protein BX663DRAFT_441075, partial [Cokeromyces recurvatus]|uniref:uncharacterized protein n=1 Tax=Cokeromyces recurvatus TaxID=90255 RepID=UPI002220E3A4
IPNNLFRLRKRKLEAIYYYLYHHELTHNKEPIIESLQTHQLAEYLLNTIYPGYPTCKAKNIAYTDYRECREKEIGHINPLAYDYVPTTEMYEHLDEIYRIDIDWNSNYTGSLSIDLSSTELKRSIERIQFSFNDKSMVEGFMHVNITKSLKECLVDSLLNHSKEDSNKSTTLSSARIQLEIELHDNEEYNINHISISAVIKKSTDKLVSELYLQATTENIAKAIKNSLSPLVTQRTAIHLLRQYCTISEKLKNAEALFLSFQNHTLFSSSNKKEDQIRTISLVDLSVIGQRIRHPIKSVHCQHDMSFDATIFFDKHAHVKLWYCPICCVHIKSFEELRIDYTAKLILNQYSSSNQQK